MTRRWIDKESLRKWKEEDEEARAIRHQEADWEFIRLQSSPIREALEFYVEQGDLHLAARLCGMTVDEFNQLRMKAKIPVVL